jgi:uncharacterized protein YcaQ
MTREEEIRQAAFANDLGAVSREMFELGAKWADEHPHKPTIEEILKELRAHREYTERFYNLMGQIPPIEQLAVLQMEEGRKQAIDKAVNWLSLNAESYGDFNPGKLNDLVVAFRKSMEE